MFDVIIAANGVSNRIGFDKLSCNIGKITVLQRTVNAFRGIPDIDKIIVVGDPAPIEGVEFVKGGASREESVFRGLQEAKSDYVLVHDGARPFVSRVLIERVMQGALTYGGAVPCLPVNDSLRISENGRYGGKAERSSCVAVQTPQGFETESLLRAFREAGELASYTDESEIYSRFVAPCVFVEGEQENKKITYPYDLFGLNARAGCGFDVHRFTEGKELKLCGVTIPYEYGLLAHSDGDAPLHALMDALLSAVGERDIGVLFPDDDPRYENADSALLLEEVMRRVRQANAAVNSVSVTVIAQAPRLSPYIEKMRLNIAALLDISPDKVAVAATTTENLGLIGEKKALAAMATVVLV